MGALGGMLGEDLRPRSRNQKRGSNVDIYRSVNMEPPPLVTSFRAHTKAITSIAVNESRHLIITGSADCSVRIWTMCGRYVGTLGQKNRWGLDEGLLDLSRLPQIIPEDVRRIASANTLKTIKGGVHTQWKMVKNALAFLLPSQATREREAKEAEEKKDKEAAAAAAAAQQPMSLAKAVIGMAKKANEKKGGGGSSVPTISAPGEGGEKGSSETDS